MLELSISDMPLSADDRLCCVGVLKNSNGFTGPREFVPLKEREDGSVGSSGASDVNDGELY
jgi:hypothetical protein